MPTRSYYEDIYAGRHLSPLREGMMADRMSEDIMRLRAFTQRSKEMSIIDLSSMRVGDRALLPTLGEMAIKAQTMGMLNVDGELSKELGYGVKSRYITQRLQDRLVQGELNRRFDRYSRQYTQGADNPFATALLSPMGGAPAMQIMRDMANVVGMGDIYDNTFGFFDLEKRTKLDTAEKLSTLLASTITRKDLQGAEAEGLKLQNRIADIMADPELLKNRVSAAELEDFKLTSGFRNRKFLGYDIPFLRTQEQSAFTLDEQRQMMMRASQMGEFVGVEASYDIDPLTGRKRLKGFARTDKEIAEQRDRTAENLALAGQRMANAVRIVQEETGMTNVGEAQDFAKLIAGGGRIGNLTRQDIQKITSLREQLGLSFDAIKSVLESGDDIARNLNVTQLQGRAMAIQNVRSVRDLRAVGAIGETTVAAMGGESAVIQRMSAATQQIAGSEEGKRYRGARALTEMIRQTKGSRAADAAIQRIENEFTVTGRVSRSTVVDVAKEAGYDNINPGYVDTFLESRQGFLQKQLGNINVEGEQLNALLERARAQGGSVERQISIMQNDARSGAVAQSLGPEILRQLLQNKTTTKQALTERDTRRGISNMAQRLTEINATFDNEEDRKYEIEAELERQGLKGKLKTEDLMKLKDIKSVGRLETKLNELKGKKDQIQIATPYGYIPGLSYDAPDMENDELGTWYDRVGITWAGSKLGIDKAEKRYGRWDKHKKEKAKAEKLAQYRTEEISKLGKKELQSLKRWEADDSGAAPSSVAEKVQARAQARLDKEYGVSKRQQAEESKATPTKEDNTEKQLMIISDTLAKILGQVNEAKTQATAINRRRG